MGYRLCVEQIQKEPQFYGTKLYGYVDDVTKLKSFQWLAEHNMINPEEDKYCWDSEASMDIRMTASEYREFITLYREDIEKAYGVHFTILENDNELFRELYNSDNEKIISWG